MSPPRVRSATLTRPATSEHLSALLAFVDRATAETGLGEAVAFELRLAAEEACTNIVRHGYAGAPGPLTLRLDVTPTTASLTLIDEAPTFSPSAAPPPPLTGPLEDRPIGGLGWHLIHRLMDEVRHTGGPGRGNCLTLVKHLPSP